MNYGVGIQLKLKIIKRKGKNPKSSCRCLFRILLDLEYEREHSKTDQVFTTNMTIPCQQANQVKNGIFPHI